ncbi:hypothetical protein EFU61_16365 [Vibrio cholerae]|nr:hypothetical protein [Vibrio cholerae]
MPCVLTVINMEYAKIDAPNFSFVAHNHFPRLYIPNPNKTKVVRLYAYDNLNFRKTIKKAPHCGAFRDFIRNRLDKN